MFKLKYRSLSILSASTLLSSILLIGCSGGNFVEEARRANEQNQNQQQIKAEEEEKRKEEQDKKYEEMKRPIDEVIQENKLDQVTVITDKNVEPKENYQDENEFAKFVGQVLYLYYTQQLTPEQFYEFNLQFGSEEVIEALPSKEDAIAVYTTIQDMYKQRNVSGEDYEITEVILDRFKRDGYFYRKVITTNGEEYFLTSITKEGDYWKYVEDSPSPPYIEYVQ